MAEPAIDARGLVAGYGETVVLEDVSLALAQGESVSLIGRNGVGKSTLLATLMGQTSLHRGTIRSGGRAIEGLATHRRARTGLGYVPQEREVFPSLTVVENLEVAARAAPGAPRRWNAAAVFELFPQLAERRAHRGNHLSGGEQQMLAIGRALMGNPQVLLMDEPTEGLAPVIVAQLTAALRRLRDAERLAILLVEQNTRVALGFSPRVVVMNRGRIVYDGPGEALAADRTRLDALIGVGGG
ncbi:MAG TPA: ABC transporter ATP-binding protein [Burkholderiales bacterium]|nr:ABC transporter ATP-binding protein [Burkholderiales bacterium]